MLVFLFYLLKMCVFYIYCLIILFVWDFSFILNKVGFKGLKKFIMCFIFLVFIEKKNYLFLIENVCFIISYII